RVAVGDAGQPGRVDAGRQGVADEERAIVLETLGHREEVHVGHGDPEQLGLRAPEAPAEHPVAEEAEVLAELRLPLPAEPARAARDVERDHYPLAGCEPGDGGAALLAPAYRLV